MNKKKTKDVMAVKMKKWFLIGCIVFLVLLIFLPWLLDTLYEKIGLTKMEFLSYTGSVLGIVGSACIAVFGYIQTKERERAERQKEKEEREKAILPCFAVGMKKETDEDEFTITVTNLKEEYSAYEVYLQESCFLTACLEKGKTITKTITFEDLDANALNDEGYPKQLTLYCLDVDRSFIELDYSCVNNCEGEDGVRYYPIP